MPGSKNLLLSRCLLSECHQLHPDTQRHTFSLFCGHAHFVFLFVRFVFSFSLFTNSRVLHASWDTDDERGVQTMHFFALWPAVNSVTNNQLRMEQVEQILRQGSRSLHGLLSMRMG